MVCSFSILTEVDNYTNKDFYDSCLFKNQCITPKAIYDAYNRVLYIDNA